MDDIITKCKKEITDLKITCYLQSNWWPIIKTKHSKIVLDKDIIIQGIILLDLLQQHSILTLQTNITNLHLKREIYNYKFSDYNYTANVSYRWYNFTIFSAKIDNIIITYPPVKTLLLFDNYIIKNYSDKYYITIFDYYIYDYMLSISHPCILVLMYAIFLVSILNYYNIDIIIQLYNNFFGENNMNIIYNNLNYYNYSTLKLGSFECINILNGVTLSYNDISKLKNFYKL